jgi:hypothetical protein
MHLTSFPSDDRRLAENVAMLSRNNHKCARDNPETIRKAVEKDVLAGFALVIPVSSLPSIPHVMICPLGVANQFSISPQGGRTPKKRLTHDQSFSLLKGSNSLNSLTDITKFSELVYGFCLHRILYQIASLRRAFPEHRVLLMKFDFSKAYRRIHYNGVSALRCVSVFEDLAYLQLRLSFGGMGCPASWCPVSEITTDLANSILDNAAWHPDILRSPDQHLVPPPEYLSDTIPLQHVLPTMVLPPPRPFGSSDVYIDDIITTFLDTPENCTRAPSAVPLAVHVVGRPLSNNEPIPREPLLSHDKLLAEGAPSELKTVLGWEIDTRRLLLRLPPEKYTAWSQDIVNIVKIKKISHT